MTTVVVVGASLAGCHAASALRKAGFDGDLMVLGDEAHRPYDRPPLSKEYLTGDGDEGRLPLPVADPERLDVMWRLGSRVERLDVERRTLHVADESTVDYDGLVIATGARARSLPSTAMTSGPSDDVITLRTVDDARRLRRAFRDGPGHVVVCGSGFIGVEVAASARSLGWDVTMVDSASAPLSRVFDDSVGQAVARFLSGHGVHVQTRTVVERVECVDGRLAAVSLSSGERIDAGLLVVGVGAVPNTDWLIGSGLEVGHGPTDGVVVDEYCRAGDRIVAAGDVARWPNHLYAGRLMRVEQWDNAVEMGQFAGRSLAALVGFGPDPVDPYRPVPWFWSDQFDRKVQLAGVVSGDWLDTVGDPDRDRFVRAYFDGDALCGVLAWNRPRQAIIGRQMIAAGADRAQAAERLTPVTP